MINNVPISVSGVTAGEQVYRLVCEVASATGQNPQEVLSAAGVQLSIDDIRDGWARHLPKSYFSSVVSYCITEFERQAASVGPYPPMADEEFMMLCYCIITCSTLEGAIQRAASFCQMLGGRAGRLELSVDGEEAKFTMTTFRGQKTTGALFADVVGLIGYYRVFSWLCGEPIKYSEMAMVYEPELGAEIIHDLFHYPIQFNRENNYFTFPANYLSRRNLRNAQELQELLQFFFFDMLTENWMTMSHSRAIENLIKGHLINQKPIPTVDDLAIQFNVSPATLRRRLADDNTSISAIKDQCRLEIVQGLLGSSDLSLEQISQHSGFSDPRAFRRAFKHWTGESPSQYRKITKGKQS